MSKTINISEEKFRKALRNIVKEADDVYNNYEAFKGQMGGEALPNPNDRSSENHDRGTVDVNSIDSTAYNPNDNIEIENPDL